jgi:hypothetical protein
VTAADWQLASNRPPTTAEAVAHLAGEVARMEGPDRAFGRACRAILEEHGVPETYRAGSQGTPLPQRSGPWVELVRMRFLELPSLEAGEPS